MALYIGNQKVAPTMLPSTGGVSIPLEVSANGELQKPTSSFTWSLPSNVTNIAEGAMRFAFSGCTGLTSVGLSNLTTINSYALGSAFQHCTGLTSVDLSSLTTLSGNNSLSSAFEGCTNLTSVDLSSLTTMNTGSFSLATTFAGCTRLTTLLFPSLNSNSFGSSTNQFNYMLSDVTGCTVHFPSNLQSVIGSWSSVTAGFGGTNTTVLFDLPATT